MAASDDDLVWLVDAGTKIEEALGQIAAAQSRLTLQAQSLGLAQARFEQLVQQEAPKPALAFSTPALPLDTADGEAVAMLSLLTWSPEEPRYCLG
ncbi:MAG: hypothetical protein KKI08_25700, partial [Armatimonadetes bacterium]|nr:hypothetical protein [Armatimonadota bacterium]